MLSENQPDGPTNAVLSGDSRNTVERIKSVDACRLIAIIAVIAIHTDPFGPQVLGQDVRFGQLDWFIDQFSRFAVPFFFVMAGYFWAVKQRESDHQWRTSAKTAHRIALVLAAWSLIYLVPFEVVKMWHLGPLGPLKLAYWNLTTRLADPLALLGQSTKVHLWFLIALLWSLGIAAVLSKIGRLNALMPVGAVLFIIALLGKPYADTPIGMSIPIELRDGPFFGTVLFATGVMLTRVVRSTSWLYKGMLVFTVGLICQFFELYVLWSRFGTFPFQDFTIGTYFMGLGFSMVALSNHLLLQGERLSAVGQYTLGIYAVHFVYVDMLSGVGRFNTSPTWQVAYPIAVFVFSVGTVLLMARSMKLRQIVA